MNELSDRVRDARKKCLDWSEANPSEFIPFDPGPESDREPKPNERKVQLEDGEIIVVLATVAGYLNELPRRKFWRGEVCSRQRKPEIR